MNGVMERSRLIFDWNAKSALPTSVSFRALRIPARYLALRRIVRLPLSTGRPFLLPFYILPTGAGRLTRPLHPATERPTTNSRKSRKRERAAPPTVRQPY